MPVPLYFDGFALVAGVVACILVVFAAVLALTKSPRSKRWIIGAVLLAVMFGGLGALRASFLYQEVENLKYQLGPVEFVELNQFGTRATVHLNGCTASYLLGYGHDTWMLVTATGEVVQPKDGSESKCPEGQDALDAYFLNAAQGEK